MRKMKILVLNIAQQDALLQAHLALDGYDVLQGDKIVRVSYKLGPERRIAVKNINALRKSLEAWNETRIAIVKENFPNKTDYEEAKKDDDPVAWAKFMADITVASSKQDQLELLTFSERVMYENGELPVAALAVLDNHGLIEG